MGQIPVTGSTFASMSELKLDAVKQRKAACSWDKLVSAMMVVSNNHRKEFLEVVGE